MQHGSFGHCGSDPFLNSKFVHSSFQFSNFLSSLCTFIYDTYSNKAMTKIKVPVIIANNQKIHRMAVFLLAVFLLKFLVLTQRTSSNLELPRAKNFAKKYLENMLKQLRICWHFCTSKSMINNDLWNIFLVLKELYIWKISALFIDEPLSYVTYDMHSLRNLGFRAESEALTESVSEVSRVRGL